MSYRIPFNKPFLSGKELYYIAQSVLSGQISGDGLFTKKCQEFLEEKFEAKKILLTHSCTAALEMAAILCDVSPGDEVILPSFTFVTTATAFHLRGAKLVFVDIDPDTLHISVDAIESTLNKNTKVIVPVHYGGVSCDMDSIMELAHNNSVYVVEDAAQGVSSQYGGKYLGTIGDIGTFSFHETKNFICGEGGAIVINNEKFIERAEILREKGTDRSKFFRGEVDKYTWIDSGSSYLPSDILAAFLYAQLENMQEINHRRKTIFDYYYHSLSPLAAKGLLTLPQRDKNCQSNNHLFYLLLENERVRNDLMQLLKDKGILAVFHYLPLHLSPMGQSLGGVKGQLPVTEEISTRLVRLPFYYELTRAEQMEVIKTIQAFFNEA